MSLIPDGFEREPRRRGGMFANSAPSRPLQPTGEVVDGDTFRLDGGGNARLHGVDAFETGQQGRTSKGLVVPLGDDATKLFDGYIKPGLPLSQVGQSYGRPVVDVGDNEAALRLLQEGLAVVDPAYIDDPELLKSYMEAERLSRLNRRGAHGTTYQTPGSFREGDPSPWKEPESAEFGHGQAVFWDDPTPFQGLRPEIEKAYLGIWNDPKSTPDDLLRFAAIKGFEIDPSVVKARYANRFLNGDGPDDTIEYMAPPAPLTDLGDGAVGSAFRGSTDPFNVTDELGGVASSLTGLPLMGGEAPVRESIWNSDRRFGDILWNNIDQNRAIYRYDEAHHPWARVGGQLASGIAIPYGAGARTIPQLAKLGAVEGFIAGGGAGEGDLIDRAPDAMMGLTFGTIGGTVLGAGGNAIGGAYRRYVTGKAGEEAAERGAQTIGEMVGEGVPIINDGVQNAGPTPAARFQPQAAAIRSDYDSPLLSSPTARQPDYLDLGPSRDAANPPIPPGFELEPPVAGRTPRLLDRPTPEEIAASARRVQPEDVLPNPAGRVSTLDEAIEANPGTIQPLQAPNAAGELGVRTAGNVRVRGPLDVTQRLREMGGIRDEGGELSHLGIGPARKLEFGGNENTLGRLVSGEGMTLDDAALRLWEEGYFPGASRPTRQDVIDALADEARGEARHFRPDDMGEVERFRAAADEAMNIEAAAARGAPLANKVGVSATQADIAANTPPVTAYEDLIEVVEGKAGNIRLDKIESLEDIGRALKTTENAFGGFDAARRGKISHEETAALAEELGITADDLLKRQPGQALNAEQAFAARAILAKSSQELTRLAKRVRGGSDEEVTAFQRALVRHAAIQEQVSGATAEAGRALSQFRMMAKASQHRGHVLRSLIEGQGGRTSIEDAADAILDLEKVPGSLNKFARDVVKPSLKDKAVELWYNSLLSGPQTHAVNVLSNAITASLQPIEHLAGATIGGMRQLTRRAFKNEDVDRVLFSEVGERAVGLMQGAREGLKAAARTARTGEQMDFVTKIESARQEAIGGLASKIFRAPTRMLAAEDEFFKAVGRRMELNAQASKLARIEGLTGEAYRKRVAELVANPSEEMMAGAMDYARYVTYTRPLGPVGQKIQGITQDVPVLKLFLPFIRTPTNLIKYSIERSPAAPMLKEVRKNLAAGGAKRDMALAKMSLGTGAAMAVYQMAQEGHITGAGPSKQSEMNVLRMTGWQPYSIKVGDQWISYRRLDPLATTLGIAADLSDRQQYMTESEQEEAVNVLISSVMENLGSKTWLTGVGDLMDVVEGDIGADAALERLAGSVAIPTIANQVGGVLDPTMRETGGGSLLGDAGRKIQSRIPGLRESLPPRRDAFGQPIMSEGGFGPDLVSPLWTSHERNDPAANAVLESGAVIGRLGRRIKEDGKWRDLSPQEYDEYSRVAGTLTRQHIMGVIADQDWDNLSESQQEKAIDRAKTKARKEAREQLFGEDRDGLPEGFERIDPSAILELGSGVPDGFVLER